ncbi:MAG TPA: helix-turn-helix domain-containing protein, partial [Myxococcaceae bacterium]|nr:helix-turn-helix domain-containing protein [Myxococcaceae bacterium]
HALRACAGNVAQAAKALGVAKGTFYSKMKRYGLGVDQGPVSLRNGAEVLVGAPFRKLRKLSA